MNISAEASTNPDLLPSDQAESAAWINFNPGFFISGTAPGGRLRVNGGGDLGAQLRLSTDEGSSTSLRPNASLNAVLEAAENFFFIDARAQVTSQLDDPFLATTDPLSPNNTSTSYQFGVAPYIQGQLPYEFDYLVRSDNSWTNFDDSSLQFASTNSVNVERRPQPFGGVFNYTQSIVGSDIPDQGNLVSDVARLSLRYAPNSSLAFGVRIGGEKYNFALDPSNRSWQRYYGAEASWRPNDRTVLEGYWEDRLFGNAWQGRFSYRRPRAAISVNTSRQLTSTPQQFLTLPGQASVRALLDASLTTRIPDPVERQRAVDEQLATGQVPAAFTAPIIINSEGFQIAENTVASFVLYDRLDTLAFSVFYNTTTTTPGIASGTLIREKTTQQGAEVTYSRRLTPRRSMNASASWRDTEDAFDASQFTTQTQILLSMNWSLGRRTSSTIGARYQWIRSSVTNDATEAAIFASLNYSFN